MKTRPINRNYSFLLSAYIMSSIGDWIYRLGIPFLIYQETKSALSMAVAYGITFLPFILVTPFGGVLADRFNQKTILLLGDFFSSLLVIVLAACISLGLSDLLVIYLLVFVVASVSAIHHPAHESIIPRLVSKNKLGKANSYLHTTDNALDLIGPLAGGSIIALLGVSNAIWINAVSFLISLLLIYRIRLTPDKTMKSEKDSKQTKVASIMNDLKEGFFYSWQNPVIKYGCILFIFLNFALTIFFANFMYFLVDVISLSPTEVGYTIALSGAGAITGSLAAPYLTKFLPEGKIILLCTLAAGFSSLLLLAAKNASSVGIAWGLVVICNSIIAVNYFTLRQKVVPLKFLGRAVATTRMISFLSIPLASVVGGWIMQTYDDIRIIIYLMSIILVFCGTVGLFSPLAGSQRYQPKTAD